MDNKRTPIPIIYENGENVEYVSFCIFSLSNHTTSTVSIF